MVQTKIAECCATCWYGRFEKIYDERRGHLYKSRLGKCICKGNIPSVFKYEVCSKYHLSRTNAYETIDHMEWKKRIMWTKNK